MPLKQPTDLVRKIEKSGYYPALVADVLDIALAGEEVLAHLVHGETTFDLDTIRRHLSVVVLTPWSADLRPRRRPRRRRGTR